ncbi:DNA-directed RNA polymerase subunit omega [Clostridium sp. MB40-C1]|uniref:DNA-directed RNA polymerase subunit omega n=1 Tax=Clostridium sp. MB40-C1 TaxID=3070996 RepID=UPI0027E10912|nr:DNA-directed RNA polymerase subunit omega [Clostridium sp. MB40-C1]WMJ82101.1 DNA-directed RNA polymerase subunit omega [Clostridium sp. MB40-C1]
MNNSMINPSIVDLLDKVDNRYSLVTVTSKRARQLIDGETVLVNIDENVKPLTMAINEVNEGKVLYKSLVEGIK